MQFNDAVDALVWLDANPSGCWKATYMNRGGNVWLGDIEDAPGERTRGSGQSSWFEVSRRELEEFALSPESDPR